MALAFQTGFYLWFLLAIPLLLVLHVIGLRIAKKKALKFANFEAIQRVSGGIAFPKNLGLLFIRILIIILMVLAISGTAIQYTGKSNDFDIVIVIDASASMSAQDLFPNRLEVAKEEAINFINNLKSQTDLAIIEFSGTVSIKQTLTSDLAKVRSSIRELEIRRTGGTNLGGAIQSGVNILVNSQKGKMIVLLTDGRSNSGPPLDEAVAYANQFDVIVHTIGVGTEEGSTFGNLTSVVTTLDKVSLNNIAISTSGQFFLAQNREDLAEAYREISTTTIKRVTSDISAILMLLAVMLLLLEWVLSNTRFRTFP